MRREDLPIFELEKSLVAKLNDDSRLIIQAPTGSGKSTQVPQILLDHGLLGDGQVVILQPRRLATRLLAARVAAERNGRLGDEVGYQIRFENITSKGTRIRFVTEGILLRQLIQDPELRGVAAILFDEFHERHLYGDITLARALDVQERSRPALLIIVSFAARVGVPPPELLRAAELDPALFADPDASVPDWQELRLWDEAVARSMRFMEANGIDYLQTVLNHAHGIGLDE